MKVVRIEDVDGKVRQHVHEAGGSDFTLCGFTLDQDPLVVKKQEWKEGRITCESCLEIIQYCKTL